MASRDQGDSSSSDDEVRIDASLPAHDPLTRFRRLTVVGIPQTCALAARAASGGQRLALFLAPQAVSRVNMCVLSEKTTVNLDRSAGARRAEHANVARHCAQPFQTARGRSALSCGGAEARLLAC